MNPTLLQPRNISTFPTGQLFLAIDLALGVVQRPVPAERYASVLQVRAADHFRIVRLVLGHLLGDDIFTGDPVQPALYLARLYQGDGVRQLYAEVMGVAQAEVTVWQVHQFLARLAWLNLPPASDAAAHEQLEDFLYGVAARRGADLAEDYPLLGELLTPIPEVLRAWMVPLKRGARYLTAEAWVTLGTGQLLYQGLAEDEPALETLVTLGPGQAAWLPAGKSHDQALAEALDARLHGTATGQWLVRCFTALAQQGITCQGLLPDPLTPLADTGRAVFLRKLAEHTLNPGGRPWLAEAQAAASRSPGRRALSLATVLRQRYANLSPAQAMALAALLAGADLAESVEPLAGMPGSAAFDVLLPPWSRWSAVSDVDEVFRQLGLDSLRLAGGEGNTLGMEAQTAWQALALTSQFAAFFAPMLGALGWYGDQADEPAAPRVSQALAGRAIIEGFLGATAAFPHALVDTLRGAWTLDHSHATLRRRIHDDIRARQPAVTAAAVDLLHYLVLREALPELLVSDVPEHLPFGRALQSVALSHGVVLLQALQVGSHAGAAFDEVVRLSADLSQSPDPALHALWVRTLSVPALRYAAAHGAIDWPDADDLLRASATQVRQALEYLQAQQAQHAQELSDLLGRKPPDRQQLAQRMLTAAGVPQWLWAQAIKVDHWPVLQEHGFSLAGSYDLDRLLAFGRPAATVLEMVMMGEAYQAGEPTVPQAWAQAFKTFRESLVSAQARVVARLLNEACPALRSTLLASTCELSRVSFAGEEGAQGLFLRCQRGDHRSDFNEHAVDEVFIELIPAAGVIRQVEQRFVYQVEAETQLSGNIVETVEKQERHARRVAQARVTPLLAMDSDAYLQGAPSRSSLSWHQPRHGTLVPANECVYAPDGTDAQKLTVLAQAAARHLLARFLEQSQAAHEHATSWELQWAKEREYAELAARLIIPFYGCIEDLAHGEHSAGVIIGCALDVAFALIPVGQFAASTVRIVMKAGELSVLSLTRLTGQALGQLVKGLAEQSAVFAVRDLGKVAVLVGRLGQARLLERVPALRTLLGERGWPAAAGLLEQGRFRLLDDSVGTATSANGYAQLDGQIGVAVQDVGTPEVPDFRLRDPSTQRAFGPPLALVTRAPALELVQTSATTGIEVGRYPRVVPVTSTAEGVRELRIAEGCRVHVIEREEGVFDLRVDGEVYHLESTAEDAALRQLSVTPLSPTADLLQETENLCRVRRDLVPVPCASGVRLATPEPAPIAEGSESPKRTGKYPSQAMAARAFSLARMTVGEGDVARHLDVFVHEGKFCQWADAPPLATTSAAPAQGKAVVALTEAERALLALPDAPVYRQTLAGQLAGDGILGLPENYRVDDAAFIYEALPVIELGPIASGVEDARTLRGMRLEFSGASWIFVEPDTGVFYKAAVPDDARLELVFSRVTEADEINEFIRLSEQYRVVRERPSALQDQENIARLLFDLLDASERPAWNLAWGESITRYEQYAAWCVAQKRPNELLHYAANILSGEAMQKQFVELAKRSIPDFKRVAERSLPEQQHIVEVLNHLLPVQGSKARWEVLDLNTVQTPRAAQNILKQIKGANLSFIQVHTEAGQRIVYYALSGGERARDLKLQLDVTGSTERVLDDVIFRDARARMLGREPDPSFTSLPVVRDADRLLVREFGRQLDSERLIATVLKEDLAGTPLTHIKVFTVLDTCRSCGGFVLPRLKLDFPDALFSVSYLKDYALS
ncbi:deaminase domain-containing protein [uncultured Pseudomonas sp.]|uniref:deaminase domain-containing protein n=1 Tax=uncultured Pseudomonas sp. TaxID=114707 RepID=UPI0025D4699D|nr:deaminase domain-containing protein [uncultured Pseudomonas sp.]